MENEKKEKNRIEDCIEIQEVIAVIHKDKSITLEPAKQSQ